DDVVLRNLVGRNVGLLAVHGEVTVGDKLTCLTTSTCQTCAVDNIVKARFQQDNQVVAGLAWLTVCLYVVATELTFKNTVAEGKVHLRCSGTDVQEHRRCTLPSASPGAAAGTQIP